MFDQGISYRLLLWKIVLILPLVTSPRALTAQRKEKIADTQVCRRQAIVA